MGCYVLVRIVQKIVGLIPHIGLILLYIAIVLTKFNVKGKGFLDKFCIATFSTKFNLRGKGFF